MFLMMLTMPGKYLNNQIKERYNRVAIGGVKFDLEVVDIKIAKVVFWFLYYFFFKLSENYLF